MENGFDFSLGLTRIDGYQSLGGKLRMFELGSLRKYWVSLREACLWFDCKAVEVISGKIVC